MRDYQEEREQLSSFCREHTFPEEAKEELLEKLERVWKDERLSEIFCRYEEKYEETPFLDYEGLLEELNQAGEEAGISPYTLHLLIFILLSRKTWEYYQERGISREIFHASMEDLRWKLLECHKMYGIWGSFVASWFPEWFRVERFALGRMQYELIPFKDEYENNGVHLKKGDKVVNVHIPSCGPLRREEVEASYEKAAAFFEKEFPGDAVIFVCDSWLLFPPHREMLPENSNIRAFMEDYDVYASAETNGDLWRIFYGAEEGAVENLPEDSGLKRAYKKWLLSGKMAGNGAGVYVYQK